MTKSPEDSQNAPKNDRESFPLLVIGDVYGGTYGTGTIEVADPDPETAQRRSAFRPHGQGVSRHAARGGVNPVTTRARNRGGGVF